MKVVDISNQIWGEAGSPTTTSIPAIAFWVRSKLGDINNLLFENFSIDDNLEILDEDGNEIAAEAVAIIKKLYLLYDYDLQIRTNLNAISTDSILEVEDQGSRVKKVNKNEVSKTLASLKRDEIQSFNNMVTAYRMKYSSPMQVTGDDTTPGVYGGDLITNYRNYIS